MRRPPKENVDAQELVRFLDTHATLEADLDGVTRSYINNIRVDLITKRELRRYRNQHVLTVRPRTLNRLLSHFNLEEAWHHRP
jgi:hypothetical protein